MDRYVVIGNPVAHSLSPEIHAHFAAATGERLEYGRLLAEPTRFRERMREFFGLGGRGANVTVPFKLEAFALADERSERASLAGAANVLLQRGATLHADNTDGAGLVADLETNAGFSLRGRTILILGAGGATRGVMGPLLTRSPARITIANRTLAKAQALCEAFADRGEVAARALEDIGSVRADLVVNATSASTLGEALALPDSLLGPGVFAYDMAYGRALGDFLVRARSSGSEARDGLGMLVEQAAESFLAWRGVRPATQAILSALRARFP